MSKATPMSKLPPVPKVIPVDRPNTVQEPVSSTVTSALSAPVTHGQKPKGGEKKVYISSETHRLLRLVAVTQGITLKELCEEIFEDYLNTASIPTITSIPTVQEG